MEVDFSEGAESQVSCKVRNKGNSCEHGGVECCYSHLVLEQEWESDFTYDQPERYTIANVYSLSKGITQVYYKYLHKTVSPQWNLYKGGRISPTL